MHGKGLSNALGFLWQLMRGNREKAAAIELYAWEGKGMQHSDIVLAEFGK